MSAATGPRDRPAASMSPPSGGQRAVVGEAPDAGSAARSGAPGFGASRINGRPPQRPAVAIIGAGWAGLACAVELARGGCRVTVFEAAKVPGGRARSVAAGDALGTVDNGQHVLIGPYRATFALMDRIGVDRRWVLRRLPLGLHGTDGLRLHIPAWPFGLGGLAGVLSARGLGRGGRRALLRLARAAPAMLSAPDRAAPDRPVADWLRECGQPDALTRRLWAPLCVAALNTPAERASARVFARVLHDGLLAAGTHASIELPARPLGELLPEPAVAWLRALGAEVRLGCRVSGIEAIRTEAAAVVAGETRAGAGSGLPMGPDDSPDRPGDSSGNGAASTDKGSRLAACWRLQTAQGSAGPFDAVVVAVAPHQAAGLVEPHADADTLERLRGLDYEAIATVHLQFAAPLPVDGPPLRLLHRDTPQDGPGEWLVDHGDGRTSVVISAWRRPAVRLMDSQPGFAAGLGSEGDAGSAGKNPSPGARPGGTPTDTHADLAEAVIAQLRRLIPTLPAPVASRVIVEKRATFACTPGLQRPGHTTGAAGLFLAGDYTGIAQDPIAPGHRKLGRDGRGVDDPPTDDPGIAPYPATLEAAVRSGVECAHRVVDGR